MATLKIFVLGKDNCDGTIFFSTRDRAQNYRHRYEYLTGRRRHNDFVTLHYAKTNHGDDFVTRQHAKTNHGDDFVTRQDTKTNHGDEFVTRQHAKTMHVQDRTGCRSMKTKLRSTWKNISGRTMTTIQRSTFPIR